MLMDNELKQIVEALLLVSDVPLSITKIQELLDEGTKPGKDEIKEVLASIDEDCEQRGIELQRIGTGYRFHSKAKYARWISRLTATRPLKMSRALLETLAIIAYQQPVTRGDIEHIRGVSVSTDIMHRLLEREWIKQVGVREVPGRPALFGTTPEFLSYFNLASLKELPTLMAERSLDDIAEGLEHPMQGETPTPLDKEDS